MADIGDKERACTALTAAPRDEVVEEIPNPTSNKSSIYNFQEVNRCSYDDQLLEEIDDLM